jgi:uncharacterized protein YndB with AHSA1/START domain
VGRKKRQVSTSRVIAADRQRIFDLLADPAIHPVIDGSGTVREVRGEAPERLTYGSKFGMSMKMGAPYAIANTVVEFDEGRRLAWRHYHGHRWRYELEDVATGAGPDGTQPGTRVTETFDWSTARTKLSIELAGFPKRNLEAMERTLERLEEVATADA